MKRIFFVLFALLSGLLYLNVQAQQGNFNPSDMPKVGVIFGKVLDEKTGQTIEYATLGLYRQKDSSLVTGTISDNHGSFSINELLMGMYYLEAGFLGYEKLRLNRIQINPQKPVVDVGTLKIHPNTLDIDAVEVVAESNQVEYKIDKKVVTLSQDMTSSGGPVSQALENTPSIEVDIEGNVTLRGSSNYKVLIDGKPSVIDGSEALQQIPASAVHSVEIITNPSAKYDPDGAAGIINLVMKKQKQLGVNGIINASVGTRNKYSTDFLLNAIRSAARGESVVSPQMTGKLMMGVRMGKESVAQEDDREKLSPREKDIIALLAKGVSNKEMAHTLNVAESTVKIHVQNILKKLHLTSRVQAAVYAVEHGLVQKD